MMTDSTDPQVAADGWHRSVRSGHSARHGMAVPLVLVLLLTRAAAGFAGGGGELDDYAPSAPAARVLAEYERVQAEGFARQATAPSPDPARVTADVRRWRERSEELRGDPAACHYLRARIEYDACHRLAGTAGDDRAGYLDRALEQIERFAERNVRFADGHALHGAILGQKIAANPASPHRAARRGAGSQGGALRVSCRAWLPPLSRSAPSSGAARRSREATTFSTARATCAPAR